MAVYDDRGYATTPDGFRYKKMPGWNPINGNPETPPLNYGGPVIPLDHMSKRLERQTSQYKQFLERVERIQDPVRKDRTLDRYYERHPQHNDPRISIMPTTDRILPVDHDLPDLRPLKTYRNFDMPPGQNPTHQLPGTAHNLTPPGGDAFPYKRSDNPYIRPSGPSPSPIPSDDPWYRQRIPDNPYIRPSGPSPSPIPSDDPWYRQRIPDNPYIRPSGPVPGLDFGVAPRSLNSGPTVIPTTIGKYGSKKKGKTAHKSGKKTNKPMFYGI